jgi:hypothetical protein
MDMTPSTPAPAMARAPVLQVAASAWRVLNEPGTRWPWMLLVMGLLSLVPMELVLPDGASVRLTRNVLTVLLSCGSLGLWLMFVFNVLRQNHPHWARLVPGHVAALRRALYIGAAGVAVGTAMAAAWAGWSWPVVALIVTALCAMLACALRWPWVWLLFTAVLVTLSWQVKWGLWALMALAWRETPWAFAAAVLAASGLALRAVVLSGGPRHARAHAQVVASAAMMRGEPLDERAKRLFSAGWLGPTRWGAWLYAAWMHRLLARPSGALKGRLALGLGPQAHWSGIITSALYVTLLLLLVSTLRWVLPEHQLASISQEGFLVGVALVGLVAPLQLPYALWSSRREQALLALLPGAPQGPQLNRWLAVRLAGLDLAVTLGLIGIVVSFSALASFEDRLARLDDAVLAALVLGLPLALTLWRDWSRARAPSGLLQWGVIAASVAIGVLATAWVYGYGRRWYELAVWTALVALPLALWRWRRLQHLPAAWPVGRVPPQRRRTPFDPPS